MIQPMSRIDFGRHSDDYASHRPGFPASFYERIDAIVPIRGTRSVDLGTGPGTIALELAARGSTVVGIDISPEQVATASRVAGERRLERRARFMIGRAEHTGLAAGAFDLATSGQSWHWFDSAAAMSEMQRILRLSCSSIRHGRTPGQRGRVRSASTKRSAPASIWSRRSASIMTNRSRTRGGAGACGPAMAWAPAV